ncbi:MAG: long-chain fatty acid--CoA ligase [Acidimicrobiia bacterium]
MATHSAADIDDAIAGQTLLGRFLDTVDRHGSAVALRHGADDAEGWTFDEYRRRVAAAAGALRRLEVGPGDRVVLMMRNVPAFHVLDLAVLALGATPVSIYNSSAPEQVAYLVGHSRARLAVVEDAGFRARFDEVRAELPELSRLAVLDPAGVGADGLGPDDVLDGPPLDLVQAAADLDPWAAATVIYTSGTTGPPKGVVLTHRNLLAAVEGIVRLTTTEWAGFKAVSYLPMAHIAERMVSHYLALSQGFEVTTCADVADFPEVCRQVRPDILFGVPRVWEKFHAGVQAALAADPEKKQKFDEGVAAATEIVERTSAGTATPDDEETWKFLDAVAFSTVRQLLGFDRLKYAVSGAAPIPADLLSWFRAIGVPLSEIYGMSETSALISWEPRAVRPGTVGRPFPGLEVFVAPDGEVCCRGPVVFAGYLDDPEKTAEALDPDGTLHTGDIGEIDADGYLRIVDRKKELIITAGGKNVSPANLEAAMKLVPLVGQAAAIGDQRPYVGALVVLDPDVAPSWARAQGIEFETLADLARDPRVVAEIERGIEEVMDRFNHAERVKRIRVLADEWLPDSDELTPTSKLKRRGIHAKYGDEIEALYDVAR